MLESLIGDLRDAHAHADEDVYAIVLTGNGRAFSSGGDTGGMGDSTPDRVTAALDLWRVQYIVQQLYNGPTPTIAAINGPAIGAGCDFTLAWDFRIMSEDAFLRQQFVNIGLVPGDGGGWLLPRLIGESNAKELILTGKDITPALADEVGLVTEITEPDDLMDAAIDLAITLRDKPRTAMRLTKDLIDSMPSYEEYAHMAIEYQWGVHDRSGTRGSDRRAQGRRGTHDRPAVRLTGVATFMRAADRQGVRWN